MTMRDAGPLEERAWLASLMPPLEQLDELLGDDPSAALLGLARTRAIIEPGYIGDPGDDPEIKKEFALAQAAAVALKQNPQAPLTSEQLQALHAFVHLLARPALRVVDGAIPKIPGSWPSLSTAHVSVMRRIRGVGRVDTCNREHVGTGWFVAADLLLTNRHVAGALCGLNPQADPAWLDKLPAAVAATNAVWDDDKTKCAVWDPAEAPDATNTAIGRVTKIRAYHSMLDMALLDVSGVENSQALVLPMRAVAPAALTRHDVYVAGYPGVKSLLGVSSQMAKLLFPDATVSGLKRVSPGQLLALLDDLPIAPNKPRQSHDGSTLGGSSGSPIIDFDNHRVIALHYRGQYGVANYAVPLWLVKDDVFFSNNGVGFVS